jgi:hypothetical protein
MKVILLAFNIPDEGILLTFNIPDEGILLTFNIPDEGYSSNISCALN